MFRQARMKLTLWYLIIIMSITLLFNVVIYSQIGSDYSYFEKVEHGFQREIDEGRALTPRNWLRVSDIQNARNRLISILGIIDFTIFGLSAIAGYFLAGETLKPIKKMVDEQKRFVSDSSHELKTPLTSLRSEIEVALRKKNLTNKEAKKILESNLEEVISLQKLSENLLELAQNGESKFNFKKISVNEIVDAAIKKVSTKAKEKQIKIDNKTTNTKVLGIEDRLIEVFVILLDNSIKYSPNKSSILIKSIKNKELVKISVIDGGIGIPKNDLPYIFERFYRGDKSRSQQGFGLGLSIAKKIIEMHGGTINVESKPKKETIFTINLYC